MGFQMRRLAFVNQFFSCFLSIPVWAMRDCWSSGVGYGWWKCCGEGEPGFEDLDGVRREFSTAPAFGRSGGWLLVLCGASLSPWRRRPRPWSGSSSARRRGGGVDVGHRSCRNRAALRSAVEVFCPGYEGLAAGGVRARLIFCLVVDLG